MANDIISNSYTIGVNGRNLVLNTLGRIYVKVRDRYYEIDFRNEVNGDGSTMEQTPDVVVINSAEDIESLVYPGDGKIIISEDGKLWITKEGEIKPVYFEVNQESLTLKELTVNGQIIVNSVEQNLPPFVVDSQELVKNLNVQFLNGLEASQFAVKTKSENITGNWRFRNLQVQNMLTGGSDLTIDFANDKISVCDLDVRCSVKLPPGTIPDSNSISGNYSGFKNITYFGREFDVKELTVIDEESDWTYNDLAFFDYAYEIEYLENFTDEGQEITYDQWLSVFYNIDETEDSYTKIDIANNKDEATQKIQSFGLNKTIDDYAEFWTNNDQIDTSTYLGYYLSGKIPNFEYIPFGTLLPGDIITLNVSGEKAKVVEISSDRFVAKLLNEDAYPEDNTGFIKISEDGDTSIVSIGSNTPYLNVVDDSGKVLGRIGNLEGLKDSSLKPFGVYLNEPHIRNVDLVGGNLNNVTLDCNSTIPNCLLDNRTYTGVTLNDSIVNGYATDQELSDGLAEKANKEHRHDVDDIDGLSSMIARPYAVEIASYDMKTSRDTVLDLTHCIYAEVTIESIPNVNIGIDFLCSPGLLLTVYSNTSQLEWVSIKCDGKHVGLIESRTNDFGKRFLIGCNRMINI